MEWSRENPRTNVPTVVAIAYSRSDDIWFTMNRDGHCQQRTVSEIGQLFFDEVKRCHFQH